MLFLLVLKVEDKGRKFLGSGEMWSVEAGSGGRRIFNKYISDQEGLFISIEIYF